MQDSYIERTKTPEQMLGRVIEEAGEVLHIAGKIIRFGEHTEGRYMPPLWFAWLSTNPELPIAERETNRDALRREMWDLKDAIERLETLFTLEDAAVAGDMQNA